MSPTMVDLVPAALVQEILSQNYRLPWFGIHGVTHWARVFENGMRLSELTGANPRVVALFSVFHDAQRQNDGDDEHHGQRGAELAKAKRDFHFTLSESEFDLLHYACVHHAKGLIEGDVTVRTCWDADRLDLGRVGVKSEPDLLCTDAARDAAVLEWAWQRSCMREVPWFVHEVWVGKLKCSAGEIVGTG